MVTSNVQLNEHATTVAALPSFLVSETKHGDIRRRASVGRERLGGAGSVRPESRAVCEPTWNSVHVRPVRERAAVRNWSTELAPSAETSRSSPSCQETAQLAQCSSLH